MRGTTLFLMFQPINYVGSRAPGKAFDRGARDGKAPLAPLPALRGAITLACLLSTACHGPGQTAASGASGLTPLEVMLESPPATLNPRMALDATGQRLGELVFRALTRKDPDLMPRPDLAESWEARDSGRTWSFRIRPGQRDQSGADITPARIAACLESYRIGKPPSPFSSALPGWTSSSAEGSQVIIRLARPDPYLASDLSVLRYYTTGDPDHPCAEPRAGQTLIASGAYRPASFRTEDLTPDDAWLIIPWGTGHEVRRPIRFSFIPDDESRAFRLMREEVDATQYSLSASKTHWISSTKYGRNYQITERDGVTVSYLSFNLRDPLLADPRVRRAIALALDRDSYVRYKLHGYARLARSLLSPELPESFQPPEGIPFDPEGAKKLLDETGHPPDRNGIRLRLHYKTTPQQDNLEQVLAFQGMLRKVGIEVEVDVMDLSVFLASIRKGAYQLYSSRWTGISDGSILYRTLHTGSRDNRAGYHNEQVDGWLDAAMSEPALERRIPILRHVQEKMLEDLPYLPLWYWKGVVFVRKKLQGPGPREVSLSGSLEPFTKIR